MSYRNKQACRTTFAVAGSHYTLGMVRDHWISKGLVLVPWDQEPDLCLVGAEKVQPNLPVLDLEILTANCRTKTVLLSTPDVYGIDHGDTGLTERMAGIMVADPTNIRVQKGLYTVTAESLFLSRNYPTLVVRPFNVYGPHIDVGVIPQLVKYTRQQEPVPMSGHGYQKRSFLHEVDYLDVMDSLVSMFLRSSDMSEVFNVGHSSPITIKRLVDTVWGMVHGPYMPPRVTSMRNYFPVCNRYPDVSKVCKVLNWRPSISLRKGLFLGDVSI